MKVYLPIFVVLLVMMGCAQKPTTYEMAQADYGQVPASYENLITHKIKEFLPNPNSVNIHVARPFKAVRKLGLKEGGKYEYGNVVYAWVTPQNNQQSVPPQTSWVFWWSQSGWNTLLPSLDGITPKYPRQAQEYTGLVFY